MSKEGEVFFDGTFCDIEIVYKNTDDGMPGDIIRFRFSNLKNKIKIKQTNTTSEDIIYLLDNSTYEYEQII